MFAKDRAGNIWNLGEYPEEYPGGVFTGAPNTWFAGVEDAEPGIHMPMLKPADEPEYVQGSVPSIDFLDCGQIVETGASVCVPAGCFDDVLVVHERSPLDPSGGIQVKYHAPGVGIVQIGALDDPEGETLVLTEFNRLDPGELQTADKEARILDQRGKKCNEIYSQTLGLEGPNDGDWSPYYCPEPPPPPVVDSQPAFAAPAPAPAPAPPPPLAAPAPVPHRPRGARPERLRRARHAPAVPAQVRPDAPLRGGGGRRARADRQPGRRRQGARERRARHRGGDARAGGGEADRAPGRLLRAGPPRQRLATRRAGLRDPERPRGRTRGHVDRRP